MSHHVDGSFSLGNYHWQGYGLKGKIDDIDNHYYRKKS
jgi:hypothetical protein